MPTEISTCLQQPHPLRHTLQGLQRLVQLRLRMFAGKDRPDSRLPLRDSRKGNPCAHYALVKESARELHRRTSLTHDNRRDGRLGGRRVHPSDIETYPVKLTLKRAG